jgi:hypothetical protein
MAEHLQIPKSDSTLGALFLGNVFAAMYVVTFGVDRESGLTLMPRLYSDSFYGVTCVQTYMYYGKNRKDYLAIKILVCTRYQGSNTEIVDVE